MTLKLKASSPREPFTFDPASPKQDGIENSTSSSASPSSAPRPPAELLPERDMHVFGSTPLAGANEVGRGLIKCGRCGRVTQESAALEHKRVCSHVLDGTPLTVKKVRAGEKTTAGAIKKRRASDASNDTTASPTKKRPKASANDDDDEGTPLASYKGLKKADIKKLEKEKLRAEKKEAKEREKLRIAERKRQRASNPLNLDRQCGVINDKGLPCSRSLTCKTHTVGAKRAVQGRTRPYDLLYLEWQRAHNPNFKEPTAKKDAAGKRAEKVKDGKAGGGANKKKKDGTWGEDDGVLEGVDAQRELEELVHMARLAGDRIGGVRTGAWFGISGIGSGGVGRVGGVWRAATYEYAQVGDMFTKALAARTGPRMTSQAQQSASGQAASGLQPKSAAETQMGFPITA